MKTKCTTMDSNYLNGKELVLERRDTSERVDINNITHINYEESKFGMQVWLDVYYNNKEQHSNITIYFWENENKHFQDIHENIKELR